MAVIETTGFAHPRVIPNLADAAQVMARITRRPGTAYRALVPNARGAARAADAGVDETLGLLAVSETYCFMGEIRPGPCAAHAAVVPPAAGGALSSSDGSEK